MSMSTYRRYMMGYRNSHLMIHRNNESPQYRASEVEGAVGGEDTNKDSTIQNNDFSHEPLHVLCPPSHKHNPTTAPMNGHTNENQALVTEPIAAVPQRQAVTPATTTTTYTRVETTWRTPIPSLRCGRTLATIAWSQGGQSQPQ